MKKELKMIHLIYKRNGIEYSWLNCKSKRTFQELYNWIRKFGPIEVIKFWED